MLEGWDNGQCLRWEAAAFPETDPVWIVEVGGLHVVRVCTYVCVSVMYVVCMCVCAHALCGEESCCCYLLLPFLPAVTLSEEKDTPQGQETRV